MALGGEGTAAADGGGGRRWRDRGPAGHGAPYTTAVTVSAEDFGPILAQVREFVRDAVVPREREIADTNAVPDDLRAQAAEMGLFGYAIPEEYGGLGLDLTQDVELALELGYTSLAFRSLFGTNNGIAGQVLVGYGTDAQKKRWLRGDGRGPRGGLVRADRAGGRVRTRRACAAPRPATGDGWIINGQKRFITNAPIADLFVAFAKVDGLRRARRGGVPRARGHARGHGRAQGQEDGPGGRDHRRRHLRRRAGRRRRARQRRGAHRLPRRHDRARPRPGAHLGGGDGAGPRALDESVAYAAAVRQGGVLSGSGSWCRRCWPSSSRW